MITQPNCCSRILSALVVACAMGGLYAQPAAAQTAGNLKCNKCVDTKDIDKKAVTKSRIKNDAVTFGKLNPKVEGAIKQDRTFYVTLDSSGAEATLVTQGPLRMFARCFVNVAGQDRIEIVHTSTASGWFVMGDGTPRAPGEQVIVSSSSIFTGITDTGALAPPGSFAPDGSTIGAFSLIGRGLNVFGHRCLVFGSTAAITGSP